MANTKRELDTYNWYLEEKEKIKHRYAPDVKIGIVFNTVGVLAIGTTGAIALKSRHFEFTQSPEFYAAMALECFAFYRFTTMLHKRALEFVDLGKNALEKMGSQLPDNRKKN